MVYVDLVMLLNFAVDLLLLMGTNRLSGFPSRRGRCFLAAMLGGLYGAVCLLPGFRFLGNLLWRIVALAAMAVTAFGADKSALRRGALFVMLSMALGGIALGLGRGGTWQLIAAAAGLCLLSGFGFSGKMGARQYVSVEIIHRGVRTAMTALKDTGNSLRDPITGEPVLVVGPEAAKKLLGLSAEQLATPIEAMTAVPGLRLIPFRAVGSANGMLLAFRPEMVCIDGQNGRTIVAFAPDKIGNEGYQALAGGLL